MRNIFKTLLLLLPLMAAVIGMDSCRKDVITGKGVLSFTTDTLTFDTVFTTLGSTTRSFKIRNTQSSTINISEVKLMQLQGSQFRINVDGRTGTSIKDVEILAHDSIYVFVEVTVNPNNGTNPLVIYDQIHFTTDGQTQQVVLEAFGQNAYYHLSQHITSSVTWPNDKPHIILNKRDSLPGLSVGAGATLTIQAGTKIYMGPNMLISVDGNLDCSAGTLHDSIVFQPLRLERSYIDRPGQWLGILYSRGSRCTLTHTIINGSTFGISDEHVLNVLVKQRITTTNIQTYASATDPIVTLRKCIIKNTASTAMSAFRTTLIAENCLFHSAGGQMVVVGVGGNYTITHCTMANVYNSTTDHKSESFIITDQIQDIDKTTVGPFATICTATNTVIYGTLDNELLLVSNPADNYQFKNCLIKIPADTFHLFQPADMGCIFGQDPGFRRPYAGDYTPDSLSSPLTDHGIAIPGGPTDDLYDYTRTGLPDIGAIEWHP